MTTDNQNTVPTYRLHPLGGILWATVLGTATAGGLVLAWNFWHIGEKLKAWLSILFGLLTTFLFSYLGTIFPPNIQLVAIALPQVVITLMVTHQFQGKALNKHIMAGGKMESIWKGVVVGCFTICIILFLLQQLSKNGILFSQ